MVSAVAVLLRTVPQLDNGHLLVETHSPISADTQVRQ